MNIFRNPVVRITLGLVSLTVSLLLAAQLIGLLPDRVDIEDIRVSAVLDNAWQPLQVFGAWYCFNG
jgi:hypothetical protein